MATKKRTAHRTAQAKKKVYAKRGNRGEFEDIQKFKKAHGQDIKRVSKPETAARKKAGLPARKKATKK